MSANISFNGHLGRDPEIKTVRDSEVCEFSVAVNSGYGEQKSTAWFRVSVWGKPARAASEQLHKGSAVSVVGEFLPREFQGQQGTRTSLDVKCYRWEHVGPREDAQPQQGGGYGGGYGR